MRRDARYCCSLAPRDATRRHNATRSLVPTICRVLNLLRRTAVQTGRLELIAGQPIDRALREQGLPPQCETEFGERCIAREIHRRRILIARLVIMLRGVFVGLRLSPFRRMAGKFYSGVDREGGNSGARETEMIGAIVMPGVRF